MVCKPKYSATHYVREQSLTAVPAKAKADIAPRSIAVVVVGSTEGYLLLQGAVYCTGFTKP